MVTTVNGATLAHAEDLPRTVAKNPPGSKVTVTLLRGGKAQDVTVTLDKLQDDDAAPLQKPGKKAQTQPAARFDGPRVYQGI